MPFRLGRRHHRGFAGLYLFPVRIRPSFAGDQHQRSQSGGRDDSRDQWQFVELIRDDAIRRLQGDPSGRGHYSVSPRRAICRICTISMESWTVMARPFTTLARTQLAAGPKGFFYGTTQRGGTNRSGSIIRWGPAQGAMAVFTFSARRNQCQRFQRRRHESAGALVLGPDGNFYGTTQYGGSNGTGTIFQVRLPASGCSQAFILSAPWAGFLRRQCRRTRRPMVWRWEPMAIFTAPPRAAAPMGRARSFSSRIPARSRRSIRSVNRRRCHLPASGPGAGARTAFFMARAISAVTN